MHTGTRWVDNHNIGRAVRGDELVVEHVFHVAGVEDCVCYAVALRVDLGIFNSLGHIFYTHYFCGAAAHKVCNRACAGIEFVDKFGTGKPGKITHDLIELVCL